MESLLAVEMDYIMISCEFLWEVWKVKLSGDPCSTQLPSQSLAGDSMDATVVEGQRRIGKV